MPVLGQTGPKIVFIVGLSFGVWRVGLETQIRRRVCVHGAAVAAAITRNIVGC